MCWPVRDSSDVCYIRCLPCPAGTSGYVQLNVSGPGMEVKEEEEEVGRGGASAADVDASRTLQCRGALHVCGSADLGLNQIV